jgi:hypothetical protein
MSDDTTPRLALPMLVPGQAQKELYHNEALALIDMAIQAAVISVSAATPPSSPAIGDCWILGAAPGGDWAGHARQLAGWSAGGWRFISPREGMTAWSIADNAQARFSGADWTIGETRCARVLIGGQQIVGARRPAIAAPAGGVTIDAEARTVLNAVLGALTAHGLIAT